MFYRILKVKVNSTMKMVCLIAATMRSAYYLQEVLLEVIEAHTLSADASILLTKHFLLCLLKMSGIHHRNWFLGNCGSF